MGYEVRRVYHGYTNVISTEMYPTLRKAKDAAEEWARASRYHTAYIKYSGKTIKYQIQQQLVISED